MYFYSDTEPKGNFGGFDISRINPNAAWLKHYENYIQLSWMLNASDNWQEKHQLTKELGICNKKLDFWYKRDGFHLESVLSEVWQLKKLWEFEPKDPWT